ncbi:MAG: hypothetical protein ACJ73E_06940, partial [Mycobacteriales bacterium]
RSTLVPGLVDGLVTAVVEDDGSISIHLRIGSPGTHREDCPHIEFVLDREHAGTLGETLLRARRPHTSPADAETPPVPCCIGIWLDPAQSDR